ncbi:response regulator [Paenibacillus tarimensis]|uniref:response regulator n=1 Tax=Paenibacillus tarimensis TaxID=416012 RepID=UPI001F41874C|nr:response regulator [Paenibacillus tarimensis]MCF2945510.1 response regulator [Paenibacillus tarimensis]
MNILLVDDEPVVRSSMARMISGIAGHYLLHEAEDGEDAIDLLGRQPFDLVITDIQMPAVDGLELAGHIRKNYPETAIVMLTGHAEFEYARRALSYGVKDYLLKPVSVDVVKDIIAQVEEGLSDRRQKAEISQLRSRELFEKKVTDLLYEMPLPYYDESLFPDFKELGVMCLTSTDSGFRTRNIRFSIKNILSDLLADYGTSVTVIEETHLTCILFLDDKREADWEAILKTVQETISGLLRLKLMIRLGGTARKLSAVSTLYQKALKQIGVLEQETGENEPEAKLHRIIRMAQETIDKEYATELTLTALSEKLFVHPNYLSSLFKAETGQTFSQYVTRTRMKHARRLLKETNLKIYQISSEVGYSDQVHFSRVFKSLEGMNPYEYREKHANT